MGGKSAKQKAQTGQQIGYWPFASMFSQHNGLGLAPFFGQGSFGGCGCGGYGGRGGYGGISPLAFPLSGGLGGNQLGGGGGGGFSGSPFGGFGSQFKGTVNLKDTVSGAGLKLKW